MSINLYYLSVYALPIANVCLLAAAALVIVRIQRVLHGKAIYSRLSVAKTIEKEIVGLIEQNKRVSDRLDSMQITIGHLGSLERLLVGPVSREMPMEHAARLAKDGASIDELTRNCGLNIGEARLVRRLHGGGAASQQAA